MKQRTAFIGIAGLAIIALGYYGASLVDLTSQVASVPAAPVVMPVLAKAEPKVVVEPLPELPLQPTPEPVATSTVAVSQPTSPPATTDVRAAAREHAIARTVAKYPSMPQSALEFHWTCIERMIDNSPFKWESYETVEYKLDQVDSAFGNYCSAHQLWGLRPEFWVWIDTNVHL